MICLGILYMESIKPSPSDACSDVEFLGRGPNV